VDEIWFNMDAECIDGGSETVKHELVFSHDARDFYRSSRVVLGLSVYGHTAHPEEFEVEGISCLNRGVRLSVGAHHFANLKKSGKMACDIMQSNALSACCFTTSRRGECLQFIVE